MTALTVPEVRRLLRLAAEPVERRAAGRRRADWRHAHQATARRCHIARRERRRPPPTEAALPVVAVPSTPALTDAAWARAAPLLPGNGRRGQQWREHRQVLGGILWVMHTGAAWRDIPAEFGVWQTAHSRYRRWCGAGTWDAVLAALQPPPDDDRTD